mgnify:FL=1
MKAYEFSPYFQKFVTVILDNGSEVSGYISNVDDLKNDSTETLDLVNGLQASTILLESIVDIHESVREDTLQIPIVPESESLNPNKKSFSDKLDELFSKTMDDVLEVKLPNGKIINNKRK